MNKIKFVEQALTDVLGKEIGSVEVIEQYCGRTKQLGTGRGGNGVFKDYLGKSDKIDGNWVQRRKLIRKLKMTKQFGTRFHLSG